MRPLSQQMQSALPAILSLLMLLLLAAPYDTGITYTPNIAWVMTLVVAAFYPPAWPRGFAFLLGLLQDVLFSTPLGSQALLTLLLTQFTVAQSQRQQALPFRVRWLEASGALIVWHLLLWLLLFGVASSFATLRPLLREGLVSALWFPPVYFLVTRAFVALPSVK